jgi:hypothetical protein
VGNPLKKDGISQKEEAHLVLLARIVTLPLLVAAWMTRRGIFLRWALVILTRSSRNEGVKVSLFILHQAGEEREELAKEQIIPQSIREEVWIQHRKAHAA